jgi:hypothetical protein
VDTVNESLTTIEDGDTTVNERLSPGGPGPEGQPDTVAETLSGPAAGEPTPEPEPEPTPAPKSRKAAKD